MATFRGTLQPGDAQQGTYGNDRFFGSRTDDVFYGDYGADRMEGKRGNDTISGGADVDFIYGGRGNDTLNGDEGYGNRLEGATGNDHLISEMEGGNWAELVGGRGADTFDVVFDDNDSDIYARSWTDIRDFNAEQGDKLQLTLHLRSGETPDVIPHFDSDADGRLTDADDAVTWDGRALQLATETTTLVLWNQDHIDTSMLIG